MNVRVGRGRKENYTQMPLWFLPLDGAAVPPEADREASQHLQLQPRLENISSGFTEGLTPRQLLHSLTPLSVYSFSVPPLCDGNLSVLKGTFSDRCATFCVFMKNPLGELQEGLETMISGLVFPLFYSLFPLFCLCLSVCASSSSLLPVLMTDLSSFCVCCGETPV